MIRRIRNFAFVTFVLVLMFARTTSASSCSPWNSSILGATGTCDECWEGLLACQENCDYWASMMGPEYTGSAEFFQCMGHVEGGVDVSCSCYYFHYDRSGQ
jgi:hypothetical protein